MKKKISLTIDFEKIGKSITRATGFLTNVSSILTPVFLVIGLVYLAPILLENREALIYNRKLIRTQTKQLRVLKGVLKKSTFNSEAYATILGIEIAVIRENIKTLLDEVSKLEKKEGVKVTPYLPNGKNPKIEAETILDSIGKGE